MLKDINFFNLSFRRKMPIEKMMSFNYYQRLFRRNILVHIFVSYQRVE